MVVKYIHVFVDKKNVFLYCYICVYIVYVHKVRISRCIKSVCGVCGSFIRRPFSLYTPEYYVLSMEAAFTMLAAFYFWIRKITGFACRGVLGGIHFWLISIGGSFFFQSALFTIVNWGCNVVFIVYFLLLR